MTHSTDTNTQIEKLLTEFNTRYALSDTPTMGPLGPICPFIGLVQYTPASESISGRPELQEKYGDPQVYLDETVLISCIEKALQAPGMNLAYGVLVGRAYTPIERASTGPNSWD